MTDSTSAGELWSWSDEGGQLIEEEKQLKDSRFTPTDVFFSILFFCLYYFVSVQLCATRGAVNKSHHYFIGCSY